MRMKLHRNRQRYVTCRIPSPQATFSRLRRIIKRSMTFSFKLNLVLKTAVAFFSEIKPDKAYYFSQKPY